MAEGMVTTTRPAAGPLDAEAIYRQVRAQLAEEADVGGRRFLLLVTVNIALNPTNPMMTGDRVGDEVTGWYIEACRRLLAEGAHYRTWSAEAMPVGATS